MNQWTISKRFHFSASHILEGLEKGHPCGRLHGHNYTVELILSANSLNDNGFVVDYRKLESFKKLLDNEWDHRHLNDFMNEQTSAENIAKILFILAYTEFPQLEAVRVSETDKTWAEYRI